MFWTPEINTDSGPYDVVLKRGEFIDHGREDRHVPFKIYHPSGSGLPKIPVIFWSHGYGGNRDGAAFLSRYVASYGYIIVHFTHHGTDSSLWEGKAGHPWDVLRNIDVPRKTTLNRFKDVAFVLDRLQGWAGSHPDMGGMVMDFEALGISGHSFGALTTQVIAGQLVPDEQGALVSFHEPRFKAGILYSPVPVSHHTGTSDERIYESIAIPLLHMTGTDDESPLQEFGYKERLMVYDKTTHPEKYALIKKGGDHMVYNGTRGGLKENILRERHEEIIKVASLVFWDAYLKGDKKAKTWLTGGGLSDYLDGDGTFKVG